MRFSTSIHRTAAPLPALAADFTEAHVACQLSLPALEPFAPLVYS